MSKSVRSEKWIISGSVTQETTFDDGSKRVRTADVNIKCSESKVPAEVPTQVTHKNNKSNNQRHGARKGNRRYNYSNRNASNSNRKEQTRNTGNNYVVIDGKEYSKQFIEKLLRNAK